MEYRYWNHNCQETIRQELSTFFNNFKLMPNQSREVREDGELSDISSDSNHKRELKLDC